MSGASNFDLWRAAGAAKGWAPPPPAPWFWRLRGVRHLRFLSYALAVRRHEDLWTSLGYFPIGYDAWALEGILRGWA